MNRLKLTADQALQVFRGWSKISECFIYGQLTHWNNGSQIGYRDKKGFIITEDVPKASLSIFTGKFDKNKEPIFASLPNTKGGDSIYLYTEEPYIEYKHDVYYCLEQNNFMTVCKEDIIDGEPFFCPLCVDNEIEVISTQYTPKADQ